MAMRCYGCMQLKENMDVCEHCGYDGREPAKSHQLPPGTRLGGQYILGRVLGQGGFGITYIGWDDVMNRRVAVKEYFPTGYGGRDTRITMEVTSYDNRNSGAFADGKRRFLREAEALAKLWNIPQIVGVQRYFEENGTAYIAMEYLEGQDLRSYVKSGKAPMTMEAVMDILGPVMKGLDQVHAVELVHRDISPDNIMVLPDGSVKLLDFGAARVVENASAEHDRNTSTQAILKHGFAPPEQYRSRGALGPWSDIYALCATVLFCLTGKIPPESMSRMMDEAELDLDSIPGLSEAQKETLEKGMALKPRDRIKTAEELYNQLFGEILEARERAKQEAEAEKRRQEEALRKEEERKAAQLRRLEEERKKEQARREAERLRKEEERRREAERQEAERRRREEARRKEQARKEAEEKKQKERREAEQRKKEAEQEIERLRRESRQRRQETRQTKKQKTAGEEKKQSPLKKLLPAAAAVLALVVGLTAVSGGKPDVPAPDASEPVLSPAEGTQVPADKGFVLEITPELEMEATGETAAIAVNSGDRGAIQWQTSDPQVVTVSQDGIVTAAGFGAAEITARYEGQTDTCRVIVYPKANVDCAYEENLTGVTILGYEGTLPAEAVLPRYIDGKPVTAVARYAFAGAEELASIYIPYGVITIDDGAFYWCDKLSQIYIPDTVTWFGENAFEDTQWLRDQKDEFVILGDGVLLAYNGTAAVVTIPDTVKTIGPFAFRNCSSVQTVHISESVTHIGREAFSRCANLVHVEIPGSVTDIGGQAFFDTPWLKSIEEEFMVVGDGVLIKYSGKDSMVTVPSNVKSISSAFYHCAQLSEVTIPDSVTAIGSYAFGCCFELKQVNLGSGVVSIGEHAFDTCSKLTEISLPDSVVSIGRSAFFQCYNLKAVRGGVNLREIEDFAFQACFALSSMDISPSVERIGHMAFHMCSQLRNVSIPEGCLVSAEAFGG